MKAEFKKLAENTYGFEVGAYDKNRELIIDPVVLAYSTYLGGGGYEWGEDIAVDGSGNAYVTGYTNSTNFPTLNQYQTKQPSYDVFVTKLAANGSSLLYSTYLGGWHHDWCLGIATDGSGNAYVAGFTGSTNFPTLNQYQEDPGDGEGTDVFVTKLDTNQSGDACLIYSTYLGGSSGDGGNGDIAVDDNGNAYVTGRTWSTDFPTLNQYMTDPGDSGSDVFFTKLDTTQSGAASLLYSTYLGGGSTDYSYDIAVDGSGCAYVTGWTESSDFPKLNEYQARQGGRDVFVTKLDPAQSGVASLIYSTYLGGSGSDYGSGIAVDDSGNAFVTGITPGYFPLLNPYQGFLGGHDAFVTKLSFGPSASITVTSPNGGEEWAIGSVQDITWETTGSVGDLKITLWKDGQLLGNIADGIDPGSNAYAWTVGQHSGGTAPEGDYTIEIEEIGSDILDSSDAPFTLFIPNEPPVAVCKSIKKEADENNEAYITAADVDGGSYDPDEGDEITLSPDNIGPFGIGTHNVELIVTDQDGATDSCFAQVEVYANPSGVSNYIQDLPADYFDNPKNAEQRKKTFKSKLDTVEKLIDAGNYQEAIDKLKNDIRKKVDGENKNAWIIDPTAQATLTAYIDSLIAYLTGLL